MSLKLVEISIPESHLEAVLALAEDEKVFLFDKDSSSPGRYLVKLVLPAESTEILMEKISRKFSSIEGFRAVILPADATLPMLEEDEPEKKPDEVEKHSRLGVSKEELQTRVSDGSRLTWISLAISSSSRVVILSASSNASSKFKTINAPRTQTLLAQNSPKKKPTKPLWAIWNAWK